MTALHCFDSAAPWDRQRLQACIDHGAVAVSFYVRGTPGGFRHASKADVTLARSMGLGAVPNGEWTADFFRDCSLAEARTAAVEVREAAQACGFPDDGTITLPVSFDYQVFAAGFSAALDRLKAVQDGCGPAYKISSYAQSALINYFGHNGFGHVGHWLMASTWGLGTYAVDSPFVAMVQSHDAAGNWLDSPVQGTDINTVTRPDMLGAWWPEGSEYGDMPLDPKDPTVVKILDALGSANTRLVAILNGDKAHPNAGLRDIAPTLAATKAQLSQIIATGGNADDVADKVIALFGAKLGGGA